MDDTHQPNASRDGEPTVGESAAGEPAAGKPTVGERAAGEPVAGESAAGESAAGEPAAQVPLRAPDLARWCVTLLATSAWQAMGLIPDPVTHKMERNLDDARLAIDAAAALLQTLRPRLPEREQREFDTLLTDLRLNFVEQQARG